ncbi:hypothetical protein [Oceanispirochaeta sp.]|uniref:hypothetical protein n=1 Tax=Oceanispirochaeta sp. TaxID=2035350 RepID=UPI00260C15C6|nr:hypothetical protein [Oceanispirochaeta sp.]MDA3958512.1 hypothetical protein [Oceanispirochaeta sp.]
MNRPSLLWGKVFLNLMIILLPVINLSAMSESNTLVTVVVQFEMKTDMIRSEESYRMAMEEAMAKAMAEGEADLVIFPEYLGVFASLIPWYSYLSSEMPMEDVWKTLVHDHPGLTINELFIRESQECDSFLNDLWGDLASRYDVFILSGTRLNYSRDRKGLVNQAVVYNPRGEVVYRQNKYFLTEFEEDILNLRSGDIRKTPGFMVKDHHIRLTICRDTFLKEWETLYKNGDLWIDIKANGVEYTEDQVTLFTRALPARLGQTAIPFGITACLTGHFLDLLWEGESNFLYNEKGKVSYLDVSEAVDSFEILRRQIP